ncbi:glycosyltransferase family 2 protein [Tellurirhabdus rosea]|uniref:glycosyltransferase family 2 protein n=1 Tax=Tellurirhabdus rosea TaxID=2674997 RepID=UPI00224D031F|nr:glycosyltransferase [Tellurirhabdus rosea]
MKPLVSIIVPTFRRPALLNRCLEALLKQELPFHTFEIIVVDDGNDTATREAVEITARNTTVPLRYLGQPERRGPAAARNRGWKESRGSIIGFTDDDCIPDENWIRNAVDAFIEGAEVVSGRLVVPCSEKPTDYERVTTFLETTEFVTANCFCSRAALEKVGGLEESFDIAWREDSDLQFKFIENEIPVTKRKNVTVVHPIREAAWWACLKDERKNCYDALLYKRHPRLFRERIPAYGNLVLMYYAVVIGFLLGAFGVLAELPYVASYGFGLFTAFLLVLVVRRLWGTRLTPQHVGQTLVTTAATPFLSVYWRLYGACKHRTLYW